MIAIDRPAFAAAVDRIGIARAVLSVRRTMAPWLTVLTYHRVARRAEATLFDEGVVDVGPEQLDRQLVFLRHWFSPIGMDDLIAFASGRSKLPSNPVMVTFDDGYRDNHEVALPILLRHGVRATFFIATDYVQRRRPFWWDRVSFIVKSSPRERLELTYPAREELSLKGPEARRVASRRVTRIIKDTAGLDLDRFMDELERAADVVLSAAEERRMADATVMTWDQISALRRAGMDVQSHSHTHRVLQTLDGPSLERELVQSRAAIEEALGERPRALSYPVGRSLGRAEHLRRAVTDAGYKLGFSNATGVSFSRAIDPLNVRRISLDLSIRDPFFHAMLALPMLAY